MGKLLLIVVLINIVVLTLCTDTENAENTKVVKVTATAKAESTSDSGDASATAIAKTSVTKTTTVTKDNNSSEQDTSTSECTDTYCKDESDDCSGALQRIKKAILKFTLQFLCQLINTKGPGETILGAPLFTFYLVSFLTLYTKNKTLKEIYSFTGLNSREETICSMKLINTFYENPPRGIKFLYSTNIISDYNNNFTAPFKRGLVELVEGNGYNFDFEDPIYVAKSVNKIIAKKTKYQVKKTITDSDIFEKDNEASKLVFASGIYFKGRYEKKFDTVNTVMGDYCDSENNVVQIPYLKKCAIYDYAQSSKLKAKAMKILFEKGFFYSVIILPDRPCGIKRLVQDLLEGDTLQELLDSLKPAKVQLRLPAYDNSSSDMDTLDILKKTNKIDSIFQPETASIINSYGKKINVYLGGGRQKVVYVNDLSGSDKYSDDECSENTDNLPSYEFTVNRDFVYITFNNEIATFCGVGRVTT